MPDGERAKATAEYEIPESALIGKGVSAQSNPMEKPEDEAKAVFDQIAKEVIIPAFNDFVKHMAAQLGLIDLTKDEDKPISAAAQAALNQLDEAKVEKEHRTGSGTEWKVLSDNNLTDALKDALEQNTAARHGHGNKTFLDGLGQADFDAKVDREHRTGSGTAWKVLSDNNYDDTEKETVAESKRKQHEHGNQALLDRLQQEDIDNWNGGNVLTKDNTEAYTPVGQYQPATKEYVDQKVVMTGAADMTQAVYDPNGKGTDIFRYADEAVQKLKEQTAEDIRNMKNSLVMDFENPLAWQGCTYSCEKAASGTTTTYTESWLDGTTKKAEKISRKNSNGSWTETYRRYGNGTEVETVTVTTTKNGDGSWNTSVT